MARRGTAIFVASLLWFGGMPVAHGLAPWGISHLASRLGWSAGSPSAPNWLGLVPLAAGVALLAWVCVTSFRHAARLPEEIAIDWSPKLLLTSGPYAWTRNPMYLGELAVWLGWGVLYGSVIIAFLWPLAWIVMSLLIRGEEAAMEDRFPEAYRRYKERVPRWVGRVRR